MAQRKNIITEFLIDHRAVYTKTFKEAKEVYDILYGPKKRSEYDHSREN